MSTVAHTELPIIILHVLVAAADIPVCALQNREYERSACGWLIASTRSLAASAWTQCYRNFRAGAPEVAGVERHLTLTVLNS